MKNNQTMKYRGLTIIELMIVIAIIGIIVAVALPMFGQKQLSVSARCNSGTVEVTIDGRKQVAYTRDGHIMDCSGAASTTTTTERHF